VQFGQLLSNVELGDSSQARVQRANDAIAAAREHYGSAGASLLARLQELGYIIRAYHPLVLSFPRLAPAHVYLVWTPGLSAVLMCVFGLFAAAVCAVLVSCPCPLVPDGVLAGFGAGLLVAIPLALFNA
jgi:hypothetical protein